MSNAIDFTSPSEKMEEILFDVRLQNIYSEFRFPGTLFNLPVSAANHLAIVNQDNGQILSTVSKNYKLISNKEALEMGKEIFIQLYPKVKIEELIPFKVVYPKTLGSVRIDLIHKDVNFSVWELESWLPYLRTTNSYNRSYALSYEIGFVRKLCSNGVLFQKDTMKLKYLHYNNNRIEVLNDISQIKETSDLFIRQCQGLRNYELPRELMVALVFQILNIKLDLLKDRLDFKKINYLKNWIELIKMLSKRYFDELGSNAYSAFNVVTDLVSHQEEYKNITGYSFDVRSFYIKPTDWMEAFLQKSATRDFDYEEYLAETIANLKGLKKQTQLEWMLN
jgi:hypothetical protein